MKTDPRFDQRALLAEAGERASHYVATLAHRPVRPDPAAVGAVHAGLGRPLPDGPTSPREVLRELDAAAARADTDARKKVRVRQSP